MRPSLEQTFLNMALVLAGRALCKMRNVGCVVTDEHDRIVATGYNGRARAMTNCGPDTCGQGCEGVHAEVNALLHACGRGRHMYQTHAPCWHCMKTIVNSGVKSVTYLDSSTLEERSALLAIKAGIRLKQTTL